MFVFNLDIETIVKADQLVNNRSLIKGRFLNLFE